MTKTLTLSGLALLGLAGAAQAATLEAVSVLDRVAGKGVIHKNNAARRKARLVAKFQSLLAAS